MKLACAIVTGCVLLTASRTAHAQPFPDVSQTPSAGTQMPIHVDDKTEVLGAENQATSTVAAPVALEQPIDPTTYICGPGDQFELNFWGAQNLRLRFAADLEGRTFISKVGFVTVAGKTLAAVRTAIKAKVRQNYPGLQFDLTLVGQRTFLVHVVDYVQSPGSYPTMPLERVSSVLAKAGGVTGSRRRISIAHRDGSKASADLVLYEQTGNVTYNPTLLDGDVVTVPFAAPVVSITGAVRRGGAFELTSSKDLSELLSLAGGFTPNVTRSLPIRIVRRDEHEHERFIDVPFVGTDAPNAALADDDKVVIRSTEDLQRSVLLIGAITGADTLDAAATGRRLPFVEGDTALSLLDRAGGIRAPGDLHRSYIARPHAGSPDEVVPLDLDALLVRRDRTADRPIQMGDTIVVPPMSYSVTVEGAVARAGIYTFNPSFGIAQYIARAGGRSRLARDLDETRVIDVTGHTHDYRSDFVPQPGDSIFVPERNFSRAEIVQLAIAGAGLLLSGIAVTIAASR